MRPASSDRVRPTPGEGAPGRGGAPGIGEGALARGEGKFDGLVEEALIHVVERGEAGSRT